MTEENNNLVANRQSNSRRKKAPKAANLMSGPFSCCFFIIAIVQLVWETVIWVQMLNDSETENFNGCQWFDIAINFRILAILHYCLLGISIISTCFVCCSGICLGTKKEDNPIRTSAGLLCTCFNCLFIFPLIGIAISGLVFFILINVNFWGSQCFELQTTIEVIARYFPSIKAYLITSYALYAIPLILTAILLILSPTIIICVVVIVIVVIVYYINKDQINEGIEEENE